MADGYVQVPLDGAGKKIDTEEIVRADGTIVERDRVQILDDIRDTNSLLQELIAEVKDLKFMILRALH